MKQSEEQSIPPPVTDEELQMKLRLLADVVSESGYSAIALSCEGAMRWLTGLKHQLGEIAPFAVSPVQAVVYVHSPGRIRITFVAKPFEMPRLKCEVPQVFGRLKDVEIGFSEQMPPVTESMLIAGMEKYAAMMDRMIRPLVSGMNGHSYKKLTWLSCAAMKALGSTARQLKVGQDGLTVRGMILLELARLGVDANLVLVALSGQEDHLHPIASRAYRVEKGRWMKLVVGARYAEHIVSQTLMVKLGGAAAAREVEVYRALQQAAVEYADLYREGAVERDIYTGMIERFRLVEKETGLKGFAKSATLHHPGGGTSPLGNRDRMIDPVGRRIFESWTQFAVNPVDTLCGMKVEIQGMVKPSGAAPLILDTGLNEAGIPSRSVTASGGTEAVLPDLMIV